MNNKTIHRLFEEQVERTPEDTAVIFKNRELSYRELNEKANRLARRLRESGIGPGSIVAVMTDRSVEMMTALFWILKAGGAYLPISPDNPPKRTRHILADSGARVLLTQKDLEEPPAYSGMNLPHLNTPRDPMYVIYTSGSTGKPKGVVIEHHSLVNRLHWMQRKYPIGPGDTLLQKTPFTFDVSLWELFWWSFTGAKVCFLPPGFERFPQAIVETVEKQAVTLVHFVPSMLNSFLNYVRETGTGDVERLSSLKRVFVSGEALKPAHVKNFNSTLHRVNGTALTNLYGPTEATVDVSYFDCPPGVDLEQVPIGRPIDNIQLHVLDERGQERPVGETGELCISGVGVARGYLNRPELTAERFYRSYKTHKSYKTYYKTGDLCRRLPDGNIEFLGRIDHQVKIRGLRIELGEIESVLLENETVKECAVLVEQQSETIVNLVAYIVPGDGFSPGDLKKGLKHYLPSYMIPNQFVPLEQMPLTPSGKIDRKSLSRR
ncbi:MAG: amino acid adenylation domain-containing protein [bacterium]|nr:amino acid adenylation domain-containing protein [bacterium]